MVLLVCVQLRIPVNLLLVCVQLRIPVNLLLVCVQLLIPVNLLLVCVQLGIPVNLLLVWVQLRIPVNPKDADTVCVGSQCMYMEICGTFLSFQTVEVVENLRVEKPANTVVVCALVW